MQHSEIYTINDNQLQDDTMINGQRIDKMMTHNGDPNVRLNFDRLRSHLKHDSLALALLEAWTGRIDESDGVRAMLEVLNTFNNSRKDDDDQTISE